VGGGASDEYKSASRDFIERATVELQEASKPEDIRWIARQILQVDESNAIALAAFKKASTVVEDEPDAEASDAGSEADTEAVAQDAKTEPDLGSDKDGASEGAKDDPKVAAPIPTPAKVGVPDKKVAEPSTPPTPTPTPTPVAVPAVDAKKEAERKRNEQVIQLLQQASNARGATAVGLYRQVILLDPNNHRAQFQLGVTLSQQGDYHSALRYLERAVQLNGRSAPYRLYLGNAYLKTGDRSKARDQYEKVLAIDKNNVVAKRMLERLE
jgi:tetratricopeptide (TPR) repeat protein